MQLERAVGLAAKTTLGIGGLARWFVGARSEAEVFEAAAHAREHGLGLHVLGGGSNLVIADPGVDGLVLEMSLRGSEWLAGGRVRVAAGEPFDELVRASVERGLAGIECLSGIPGRVGATPIQNVGAYGQEVKDTIVSVRAFDLERREVVELDRAACEFEYRSSFFKRRAPGRFVVLAVTFDLAPGGAPSVRYPELERELRSRGAVHPSLADVRTTVLELRAKKSMLFDPLDENGRSCGSFFVNPVVDEEAAESLFARVGDASMPRYPQADGRVKLSAAWLIEHAGLVKGTRRGAVGLSTRHSLSIVAHAGAKASDVAEFARFVRDEVQARFGVRLEPEPVFWGFSPFAPEAQPTVA